MISKWLIAERGTGVCAGFEELPPLELAVELVEDEEEEEDSADVGVVEARLLVDVEDEESAPVELVDKVELFPVLLERVLVGVDEASPLEDEGVSVEITPLEAEEVRLEVL